MVTLKTSSLIFYSFLFLSFYFFIFLILILFCLLSLSTDPRHLFLHLGVVRNIKVSKMKRHIKRYVGSLYCNHRVRSGGTWKTMWLLKYTFPKKLTPITKLTETSLICTKLRLIGTFSTSCFFNKSLAFSSTNSWVFAQSNYMLSNL